MGRKGIAALLLAGVLVGFAPLACMPRATAQASDQETIAVGRIVQGVVTQKFNSGNYVIAVDGWPYEVSLGLQRTANVGTVVRFDGMNWTIVSGGI